MSLRNRGLRVGMWSFVSILAAAVIAISFQTGMRYRYEEIGGVMWRVDQITSQRCRVLPHGVLCGAPASTSISNSISTSTSTSMSVVVRRVVR